MTLQPAGSVDLSQVTEKQRTMWSAGDFNEIARQNMGMAETLCRAADPRPSQRVLDVACGSVNVAVVAARRYCDVTGLDYVPTLIERARRRAEADGWGASFIIGDAQDIPFPDESFDVVLSVYGVQFAPDHEKAAREMLRVCRPGGTIGLSSPMPRGWSGDFFAVHGKHNPPPPGTESPLRWGAPEGIQELLADSTRSLENDPCVALQYYRSVDDAVNVFSSYFGPSLRALEAVGKRDGDSF